MTIPTSANGWPLIVMPDPWGFSQMDWQISVPSTASTAPYTGQVPQVQVWPGADNWKVTVTIPPRNVDEARAWTSFLWDAAGGSVAFLLGDPLRRKPKGSAKPSSAAGIMVSGTNLAMSGVLKLRGIHPGEEVFVNGDLISVNYRLYQVRDKYVVSDAGGNATVKIGPTLRDTITDGMPVQTHDAQGMFRLAKNVSPFSIDGNHLYSLSLQCVEAR